MPEPQQTILNAYIDSTTLVGDGTRFNPLRVGAAVARGTFFNVVDYGAVGNGVADDSAAVRSTIAAAAAVGGGVVWFPPGTYLVSRDGGNFYCIAIPSGVTLMGAARESSVIKMAGLAAASVRCLRPSGTEIRIADLTLDGNKSEQSVNEQRHGIFAESTTRLVVERVSAQNFTGDGFYLYNGADTSSFLDCYATANDRNGFTLGGGGVSGVLITGCRFVDNAVQQLDSEPGGPCTDITIASNYLDAGGSSDFALTVSGFSAASRSSKWNITGNVINGPTFIVWADDWTFSGNTCVSESADKPALWVYRTCKRGKVIGNQLRATSNVGGDPTCVLVQGTGAGDSPEDIAIVGNDIKQDVANGFGVYVGGVISCTIADNDIVGAGAVAPGYWGVYMRATIAGTPVRSVRCVDNYIANFGSGGAAIAGSGGAQILVADVSHNTFDSTVGGVMPIGVSFNVDGTAAAQRCVGIGNVLAGNVSLVVSDFPGGAGGVLLVGGSWGNRGVYSCTGDPNGVISEFVGAMAFRRDGGAGTTLYVKEAGAPSTVWAAK